LAIGGIAATGGWVVVALAAVLIGVTIADEPGGESGGDPTATDSDRRTTVNREETGRRTRLERIQAGMCLKELPFGEESIRTLRVVDCDVPHVGEVYAVFDLVDDRKWPGEEVVGAE